MNAKRLQVSYASLTLQAEEAVPSSSPLVPKAEQNNGTSPKELRGFVAANSEFERNFDALATDFNAVETPTAAIGNANICPHFAGAAMIGGDLTKIPCFWGVMTNCEGGDTMMIPCNEVLRTNCKRGPNNEPLQQGGGKDVASQ